MKSLKTSDHTRDAPLRIGWKQLAEEITAASVDKIPDDFKTRKQIGEEMGLCKTQVGELLASGLRSGRIERKMFRVRVGLSIRRGVFFRIVPGKAK